MQKNKIKLTIAGLALASAVGGIASGGGITELKLGEQKLLLTNRQYTVMKNELAGKYLLGQPFAMDEFQKFVAILNKEAKKGNFKDIERINESTLLRKLIEKSTQP